MKDNDIQIRIYVDTQDKLNKMRLRRAKSLGVRTLSWAAFFSHIEREISASPEFKKTIVGGER